MVVLLVEFHVLCAAGGKKLESGGAESKKKVQFDDAKRSVTARLLWMVTTLGKEEMNTNLLEEPFFGQRKLLVKHRRSTPFEKQFDLKGFWTGYHLFHQNDLFNFETC